MAIIIEVGHECSKTGGAPTRHRKSGFGCSVSKLTTRALAPQVVLFTSQMCHIKVDQTVAVHVALCDSHAGISLANGSECDSPADGFVFEGCVALVDPKPVGLSVVGNKQVWPAIAIVIGNRYAQAGATQGADTGIEADVGELRYGLAGVSEQLAGCAGE